MRNGIKKENFTKNCAPKINISPEASLKLDFSGLSAASADGLALVDSVVGSIEANSLLNNPQPTLSIDFQSGEALYDTFYVNITKHPLHAEIESNLPDKSGRIKLKSHVDWKGMGTSKLMRISKYIP